MLTPIQDENEFRQVLQESAERPVFVFKHSTRCPISAAAREQFERFTEAMPEVACRLVLVVEQRPLSLEIAHETGVTHASPQALLLVQGKVVWHASHYQITAHALREAYTANSSPVNR